MTDQVPAGEAAGQEQWQLDGSAPELYERYLVPAMTAAWARDLADRADLQPGERVLDVACGTGVVARVAAQRVGAAGRVAAVDLNPGMLATARSVPTGTGAPIEWHEGSALALPFPDAGFDVVMCQLGLQFFPDRPAATQEMRRTLAHHGRIAVNVFGPIAHNPATHALADALDRQVRAGASTAKRREHALGDAEALRALLSGAGLREIVITTASRMVRFPSVADYVRIQLAATPLGALIAGQDTALVGRLVAALVTDVGTALRDYVDDSGVRFPQEVHIALARR